MRIAAVADRRALAFPDSRGDAEEVRLSRAHAAGQAEDSGLNSAGLYGIKPLEGAEKDKVYKPVPKDYEQDIEGAKRSWSSPNTADNMSTFKEKYWRAAVNAATPDTGGCGRTSSATTARAATRIAGADAVDCNRYGLFCPVAVSPRSGTAGLFTRAATGELFYQERNGSIWSARHNLGVRSHEATAQS